MAETVRQCPIFHRRIFSAHYIFAAFWGGRCVCLSRYPSFAHRVRTDLQGVFADAVRVCTDQAAECRT